MLYEDKLRRILEQQNESRENRVAKNPLDGDDDSVDSSDDDISTDELRKEAQSGRERSTQAAEAPRVKYGT